MFGHTVKAKCGHSVFSLSPAGAHGSEIKGGQFALINAARLKMSPLEPIRAIEHNAKRRDQSAANRSRAAA